MLQKNSEQNKRKCFSCVRGCCYEIKPGIVVKFTADEIKAGKTKDEILKATQIPGSREWKGEGIRRPLQAASEELPTSRGCYLSKILF